MKILAIESASVAASCAVYDDNMMLGEFTLSHKKTHSEKLMPLIENLLSELEVKIQEIDVIALSEGPGSYTGLRIGAALGKSLAYALNIPIAGVPTMKSLAANIYNKDRYVVPIMDAKAGRVYSGIYKWNENSIVTIKEQFPTNIDELIDILNSYEEKILLNGDGCEIYRAQLEKGLKIIPIFAPRQFHGLKASTLACLGYETAVNKETISAYEFFPKYLRLSQAERNIKL